MNNTNLIRRMNFFQMVGALVTIYSIAFLPLSKITLTNIVVSFILIGLTGELGGFFLLIFFPILFAGPILVAISNTALGEKVKVIDSFRKGLSIGLLFKTILVALPSVVLAFIIADSTSGEGAFIVFYVTFFVLMPLWVFFPMIVLLEKKGFFSAIGRSLKFCFLNFGRNALILIACMIFAVPFYFLGLILDPILGEPVLGIVGFQIDVGIIYAIPFITMLALSFYVMSYYEVRARREDYSVDVLSKELGFAPLEEMMSM